MNSQEKLLSILTVGGSILSTITGAIWLWAVGGNLNLDINGQVVLLIGGAILGGGVGIMFFGMFSPFIVTAISKEIRSIIFLVISLISSIGAYRMIWGGSNGNPTISIIGAFAGFFIPLIAIGFILNLIDSFRN